MTPRLSGRQSAPPSVDSKMPPLDIPMYMWRASRGSTRIECSFGPSGVPSWSPPHHALRCGCSLKPSTPAHVTPPSAERNSPCGEVPAYQTPGSRRVPRREPERVVDRAAAARLERRGLRGFLPRPPAVGRAKDGGPEVAGARRGEHRLPVARVGDRVVDDVPEEMRARELPRAARGIAGERPQALARGDQQRGSARRGNRGRLSGRGHGPSLRRNATASARIPATVGAGDLSRGGVVFRRKACNPSVASRTVPPRTGSPRRTGRRMRPRSSSRPNAPIGDGMTIKVGDTLPAGTLSEFIEVEAAGCTLGPNEFKVDDLTRGKKVAIFGLPGAFTPTCSAKHVPSYVQNIDKLKAKGVADVICMSVNDAFVMGAWARDQKTGRQGAHDGRRQRRLHEGARPRIRSHGQGPRHALPALLDAGRRRGRQGAQHRGAGQVRSLRRARRC